MDIVDKICGLGCRVSAAPVFCVDRTGKVLFANRALSESCGRTPESLIGGLVTDFLIDPPSADSLFTRKGKALLVLRDADGEDVQVSCQITILPPPILSLVSLQADDGLVPPLAFVVVYAGVEDGREAGSSSDATIPMDSNSRYRHALLNAVSPVKTAADAFLQVLRESSDPASWEERDLDLIKGLAEALEMSADQLEGTILELFPRPAPAAFDAEEWDELGLSES